MERAKEERKRTLELRERRRERKMRPRQMKRGRGWAHCPLRSK